MNGASKPAPPLNKEIPDLSTFHKQLPVLYTDVFSYRRIGMGAQILSPNFLEQGLLKKL